MSLADTLADALAGVLRVRPGQPRPHNIVGTRPDWADTLTRGRPVSGVPGLLASAYSLCGHAHRLCAERALQAAAGHAAPPGAEAERALQLHTLREHVRRIGLDWVQQLAHGDARAAALAASTASLACCPALVQPSAGAAETRGWLEAEWLSMPADTWLQQWQRGGAAWLAEWSQHAPGWLPGLMAAVRPQADVALVPASRLRLHGDAAQWADIARGLREEPGYTRRPHWRGMCAETGSWTRWHDTVAAPAHTPWQRLGARLAEAARLCLPDAAGRSGRGWLVMGALPLARGEGLAWVEMARGLLVHHALVEASPAHDAGAEPRVARYRVLAPTEWNFHPEGAVAQALENLTGEAGAACVPALMAAYDPCVRFDVERGTCREETAHA